ncbi:hypothetical protein J6590_021425 [Homalodisca vitripennis]|nr:hypothetical protein J6590_021425 [Homalodisca vitripennis]
MALIQMNTCLSVPIEARTLRELRISSEPKHARLTNKTEPSSDRGPGPRMLAAPRSELTIFNSTMSWEEFLSLFKTAGSAHGWMPSVKA